MLAIPGLNTAAKSVQGVNAVIVVENSPPTVAASCASSKSPGIAICCQNNNNNTNIPTVNCDDHLTPSPTAGILSIDSSHSQRLRDDGTMKASSTPESSSFQRENAVMQAKILNHIASVGNGNCSSALPINSPTSTINNENSNSSNSAISQIMDTDPLDDKVPQQALHECNTTTGSSMNKTNIVADCNEKVNGNVSAPIIFTSSCSSKAIISSSTGSSSESSVSAENGAVVLGNLSNVKKEQRSDDTPEISTEGFNTLPSLNGNINTGAIDDSTDNARGSSCISNLLQHNSSTDGMHANNNINGSGSHISNSMDYMQQQNHIFVFSTQLANKSAELVSNGQFPTIIAYHCTQPATKKILEDFFLKNPLKMSKIQRLNSPNMGAAPVTAGYQWVVGENCLGEKSQKINCRNRDAASGADNNQICTTSVEDEMEITALSASSTVGFSDSTEPLANDNVLMNWEQTNIGLDDVNSTADGHSIQLTEGMENTISSRQDIASGVASITQLILNRADVRSSITPLSLTDTVQPSLQGVKVPDENLTPQQRQHREEQLAKLKKMNQFLFPEHGEFLPNAAALRASNQLRQLNSNTIIDSLHGSSSLGSILTDSHNAITGNGIGNQPPHLRGPNNLGISRDSDAVERNPEVLGSETPPDEGNMQNLIIGRAGDFNNPYCRSQNTATNTLLTYTQQGLTCRSGDILCPVASNTHVANVTGNHCHGQEVIMSRSTLVPGGMISVNNCRTRVASSGPIQFAAGYQKETKGAHQFDMNSVVNTQVEWSKIHNQFYEEYVRSNIGSAYIRPSHIGSEITGATYNTAGAVGRSQGPPPPYHPTQRSASVPIATQSPNSSSPNNPTSNLSLPSPRTASGSCITTLNSPTSDGLVPASSDTSPPTTAVAASAIAAVSANPPNRCKVFHRADSPTEGSNNTIGNNDLRNSLNQFNSHPTTPLSNISPNDLESLSATSFAGEVKSARPSPQRSKTPNVCNSGNSDKTNLEGRFPSVSPGVSFSTNISNQSGVPKFCNHSLENVTIGRSPFSRRHDNLPLNPNSSLLIKQNHHNFDPISSLAQMSQQLTSCANSSEGIGGYNCVGINSVLPAEMSLGGGVQQNIDGIMAPSDAISSGIDHCGNISGTSDRIGLSLHIAGGGGHYGASDCLIGGPILHPSGSRLLTPKISLAIGAMPNVMRDCPQGFPGGIPPHRMMGRMGVNFCPFSGSPNIQVKASAPNTIQYMPARSQTHNITQRVPPSLEFLQRFANQQHSDPGINYGLMMSASQIVAAGDSNKSTNSPANTNEMQNSSEVFFPNCNQLGSGSSGTSHHGNIKNENQGEIIGGEIITNHSDFGEGNPSGVVNNREIRPVEQVSLGPGGSPLFGIHRAQAPGSHLFGSQNGMNQLGSNLHEIMESLTSDSAVIFASGPNASSQVFGLQKAKSISEQSSSQNISPSNIISGSVGMNDQSTPIQNQTNVMGLLLPISSLPNVSGSDSMVGPTPAPLTSGLGSYKSCMSQSENDLKYAQQYHNFQQQLYATSTRNNVNQINVGSAMGMLAGGITPNIPTSANSRFSLSK